MKRWVTVMLVVAICGASGCGGGETQSPPTGIDYTKSDLTPPSGRAERPADAKTDNDGPAWNRRILTAFSSDEGKTWQKTNTIFTDRAEVPSAVADATGRIFVYYQSYHPDHKNAILVAVSEDDGATWAHKTIAIDLPSTQKGADPSVVVLDDGRFRMYFSAVIPGESKVSTHSATSSDGINFTMDPGVRFTVADRGVVAPTVVRTGGQWYLFYIGDGGKNYRASSTDGLIFGSAEVLQLDGYFVGESAIAVEGGYRMFAFSGAPGKVTGVRSLFSVDGASWASEGDVLSLDGSNLESVTLRTATAVRLSDKRLMMFYTTVIP